MDVKFYISLTRFIALAAAYLVTVVGSIYGLLVSEIPIELGSLHYTLSGWPKNLICLGLLFLVAMISAYPILLAVYRALSIGNK